MQLQASRCYYHPERGAVATCTKCGVGLCQDCAIRGDSSEIFCPQCANEILRQEHKEHRRWLKERGGRFVTITDFIIPGIIGILIAVGAGILDHYLNYYGIMYILTGSEKEQLFIEYALFSAPFCYILLSDLFTPKYDKRYNIINKWLFKVVISFTFGWIVLPFLFIRFIVRKIRGRGKDKA